MEKSEEESQVSRIAKRMARPPDIVSSDTTFLAWQRNHLANERTFLSWSRTSISLLGLGFVLEKFELFLQEMIRVTGGSIALQTHGGAVVLGLVCFVGAGITILVAAARFMKMKRHIDGGVAYFSVIPEILIVISAIIVVLLAVLLSLSGMSKLASELM
jgi:putative membrane protein